MRHLMSHFMLLIKSWELAWLDVSVILFFQQKKYSLQATGTGAIMGSQTLMHVINFHFMDEVALLQVWYIFIPTTTTAKVISDESMMKQQFVMLPFSRLAAFPGALSPNSVPLLAKRGTAEFVIISRPTELIESWAGPNLNLSKSRC